MAPHLSDPFSLLDAMDCDIFLNTPRRENWKGRGNISVTRDARGRFVHWERIISVFRGHAVSVYQTAVTRHGRYEARYDFEYGSSSTGTVRELSDAIAIAMHLPPKRRFVAVGAKEFLKNPGQFGDREGRWVARPEVDSR